MGWNHFNMCVRKILMASMLFAGTEAFAAPFVGLNMGLSSIGYRGQTVRGQFLDQANGVQNLGKTSTHNIVNMTIGNQFTFDRLLLSPYVEVKTLLGDESFSFAYDDIGYSFYKNRTVWGAGMQVGYELSHFSPYVRFGMRYQEVSVFTSPSVAGPGYNFNALHRKDLAVNSFSWSLGTDIPVSNVLCVNIAFSTTYQNKSPKQMTYIGDPNLASYVTLYTQHLGDLMTAPFRRNIMDFTVGIRYRL